MDIYYILAIVNVIVIVCRGVGQMSFNCQLGRVGCGLWAVGGLISS